MASGVPTHALNALVTSELDKDNTFSLHAFAPLLIILIIEIIIIIIIINKPSSLNCNPFLYI